MRGFPVTRFAFAALVALHAALSPAEASAKSARWSGKIAERPAYCQIAMAETRFSGERRKVRFETPLRSRRECQELASIHQNSLLPRLVKSRQVHYSWGKNPFRLHSRRVSRDGSFAAR